MTRQNFASGAKWEDIVGYSRAGRVGPHIWVTGTTSTDETGAIVGIDDPYAQAKQILTKIQGVLERAGASMEAVIQSRIYVTDISKWEEIGRAHCEFFGVIKPCTTMVEVRGLIDPQMIVEIEVQAYVAE